MARAPSDRRADTSVPIHDPIAERWSPRAFDPVAELTRDDMLALLEAGRWAATWGHRQPVRYVVGLRGESTFEAVAATLKRGNSYAAAAAALILVCADEGEDERTARYAAVDVGAAIAQLTIEAVTRGLIAHPMAGFDPDGARDTFGIPTGVRPYAVVAVGRLGDYDAADDAVVERDARPRERLGIDDIAFTTAWATPFRPGRSSPAG